VTDDNHFNKAKELVFPSVKIISAADFLNIIKLLDGVPGL